MVRGTKMQAIDNGRPITSFFSKANKPPQPSPSVPSSSQGTTSSTKHEVVIKAQNDRTTRFNSIVKPPEQLLKQNQAEGVAPASITPSQKSPSPKPNVPSGGAFSLKRGRSPEARFCSSPLTSRKNWTPKFARREELTDDIDSDKEKDAINLAACGFASPDPKRKKKARVSSTKELEPVHFIPSSQSDEELQAENLNSYAAVSVTKIPSVLHEISNSSTDIHLNADINVDNAVSFESTSLSFSPKISSRREEPSFNSSTPPSSSIPSMPPTPVALDAVSKTAKIIADIKARAFAKSLSSPEPAPLELFDSLEGSSDEEDVLPVFPTAKKSTKDAKSMSSPRLAGYSARYLLRNQASVSPARASSSRSTTSKVNTHESPSRTSNLVARSKAKAIADPFSVLLKEKRLLAKRGQGTDAFRLAEITATDMDRDNFDHDLDLDDNDKASWKAATQAAKNANWLVDKTLTPRTSGSSKFDFEEEERKHLLSQGGGKTILDILERDNASKDEGGSSEKISGIRIWSKVTNSPMQILKDTSLPTIPGQHPVILLLNATLKSNDSCHAAALLNMPIMMSINISEREVVASSLFSLLSASRLGMLAGQATHVLQAFWASKMEPRSSGISLSNILDVLSNLGFDASLMASQILPSPTCQQSRTIDPSDRVKGVWNLLILITACARSGRLRTEEIPDILLVVLLLGMDSEASSEVLQNVTLAVYHTCQCIPHDDPEFETRLLVRLIDCVKPFEPINKLRFLSFLYNGAGPTQRLARLVSHCIIANKLPSQDMLSDLRDLTRQLSSNLISSEVSAEKFSLHDQTDYTDLGFYVSILSVAMSDIKEYVVRERQALKSKLSSAYQTSFGKSNEKPKTDLQVFHLALETLHSNISDTRATHLERSRTKAVIKGLAMNIHYQREFWLKYDTEVRAKTLAQYFKKKDKL